MQQMVMEQAVAQHLLAMEAALDAEMDKIDNLNVRRSASSPTPCPPGRNSHTAPALAVRRRTISVRSARIGSRR